MSKRSSYILAALVVVLAILYADRLLVPDGSSEMRRNLEKIQEVSEYVSAYYVDDVDWDKAMQTAIDGMLSGLDPHSVYISAAEAEVNEENFEGKYQGIGIQYDVIDGYLTVIAPISGSPSEKIGLMAGDRIIEIDGEAVVGITSSEVQKKLKGPKGSEVKLKVLRNGMEEPLDFEFERDEIPIFTVNTWFMFPDGTGYIYLNRFARTTEEEIESAVTALRAQGMERLILDLRWNAGGYLDQAVKLASMFISGHKKIVYTRGRLDEFNEEYYSDTFRVKSLDIPLIVMVNHASASASEIVAGAIQDYDRGLIVGETSFGKGLVQREISLKGDARLRLTISKYYTPSGRLIQRPYKNKNVEDYYRAGFDSVAAETESDSAEARPEYATAGGRTVYGGGGITPDTVVAYRSESKVPRLTQQLFNKRVFFEVASLYASEHPEKKDNFDAFLNYFEVGADLLARLKAQADKSGIEIENRDFELDSSYMKTQLKAEIARSLWEPSRFYQVLMYNDNQVNTARQLFDIATGLLSSTQER